MSAPLSSIRVLSFNIAKNRGYLDVMLEQYIEDYDILFIQEPPWGLIRHAPSTSNLDGDPVIVESAPHIHDKIR